MPPSFLRHPTHCNSPVELRLHTMYIYVLFSRRCEKHFKRRLEPVAIRVIVLLAKIKFEKSAVALGFSRVIWYLQLLFLACIIKENRIPSR
jgi:hypothetical protein